MRKMAILICILIFLHSMQAKNKCDEIQPTDSEFCTTKDAFDYLEFRLPSHKSAFQDLFQKSSIIIEPKKPSNEKLSIIQEILTIVEETQKKFVLRSGNMERWETKPQEWMTKNTKEIFADLQTLGFVDSSTTMPGTADSICILGATKDKMAERLEYAASLMRSGLKIKDLILLAGERYVSLNADGTEEQLTGIAHKFGLSSWRELTETHLIQYEYERSSIFRDPTLVKSINVHVIDTPRGTLPRPTTQTTIIKLIEWLNTHKNIQKMVFVSNQPYVKYQRALIDLIMKELFVDLNYDVVGAGTDESLSLRPIIEGLGSYIWAQFPIILLEMNYTIANEAITTRIRNLYEKNPLIFNAIKPLLVY